MPHINKIGYNTIDIKCRNHMAFLHPCTNVQDNIDSKLKLAQIFTSSEKFKIQTINGFYYYRNTSILDNENDQHYVSSSLILLSSAIKI